MQTFFYQTDMDKKLQSKSNGSLGKPGTSMNKKKPYINDHDDSMPGLPGLFLYLSY